MDGNRLDFTCKPFTAMPLPVPMNLARPLYMEWFMVWLTFNQRQCHQAHKLKRRAVWRVFANKNSHVARASS
jgi:hypothetical protein